MGEIRMITRGLGVGGSLKSLKKAYTREVNSIRSQYPSSKMLRSSEPDIVFLERDAWGIRQPYDNPLVIMLKIEGFNIHQILINNGSSIDIIYLPAYQ